jgi:hypothetical protein
MLNAPEIEAIRSELLEVFSELPRSEAELADELMNLTKSLDPKSLTALSPSVLGILGSNPETKRHLALRLARGRGPELTIYGGEKFPPTLPSGFFPGASLRLTKISPPHPDYPIAVQFMGDFSLVRLLARIRRMCPDSLEFDVEKLSFLFSRAQNPEGEVSPLPWPPGGAIRFKDYFSHNYLSFAQKALLDKYYWPKFPSKLETDSPSLRAELLSYLWGSARPLTAIYESIQEMRMRLEGRTLFFAKSDILKNAFFAKGAQFLPLDPECPQIALYHPSCGIQNVPLGIITLMAQEVQVPLEPTCSESLISLCDILEFPCYEPTEKLKSHQSLEKPKVLNKHFLGEKGIFLYEEAILQNRIQALIVSLNADALLAEIPQETGTPFLEQMDYNDSLMAVGAGGLEIRPSRSKKTQLKRAQIEIPPYSRSALGEAANLFVTKVLGSTPEDRLGKLGRLGMVLSRADRLVFADPPLARGDFDQRLDKLLRPFSRFYHEDYSMEFPDGPIYCPPPTVFWDMDPSELPFDFYGVDIASLRPLEEMGLWEERDGLEELPDSLLEPFDMGLQLEEVQENYESEVVQPQYFSYVEGSPAGQGQAQSENTKDSVYSNVQSKSQVLGYNNRYDANGKPYNEPLLFPTKNITMKDIETSFYDFSYFDVPELSSLTERYKDQAHSLLSSFSRSTVISEFFDNAQNSMGVLFAHPLGSTLRIEMKFKRALQHVAREKELLATIYNRCLALVEKLRAQGWDEKQKKTNNISEKDHVFVILKLLSALHRIMENMD